MYDAGVHNFDANGGMHDLSVSTQALAAQNKAWVSLPELAAILGSPAGNVQALGEVQFPVRRLQPGETLFRTGDEFEAFYVVRSGFLKTVCLDGAGNEQVLAFPMRADAIGVDGFDAGRYTADAIALDTCHVIIVSFARIAELAHQTPEIERLIYSIFNRELTHRQNMVRLLGMLNAEARVAAFLLDLSERFARMGCSRASFSLRMTREEMGSYLGIKLETVSRTLSAFAASGLIEVERRELVLKDVEGLQRKLATPEAKDPVCRSVQRKPAAGRVAERPAFRASPRLSWVPMAA